MSATYPTTYPQVYGLPTQTQTASETLVITVDPGVPPAPVPQPPVIPVQFPTPQYVYLATDLVTDTVLGELPLSNVGFDSQLNNPGNISANGNLSNTQIADADFIARTTPGRTALWVYRENQIVWGGILWTRAWVTVGKQFTFTGQTFESYAARRTPWSWLGAAVFTYDNSPQSFIIDDLWRSLQGVQYGNINVRPYGAYDKNDAKRTVAVVGYDLSTSVHSVISSLTSLVDGPDYTIAWQEDGNGNPVKQLIVGPKIGNPISVTNLVVDYPGSVQDYTYTEDASAGANTWYTPGSGTASSTPIGQASDQSSLASGWPLIESVDSDNNSVTDTVLLDSYASADLNHQGMPAVVYSADLFGASAPEFGSYSMGDYITINVTDPRFPDGQSFQIRVIGWSVTPPDSGSGVEQITPVFDTSIGGGN